MAALKCNMKERKLPFKDLILLPSMTFYIQKILKSEFIKHTPLNESYEL